MRYVKSYLQIAVTAAANRPYPYQYRDQLMRGFGPHRDSLATRLGLWLDENKISLAELSRRCNENGLKYFGAKVNPADLSRYLHSVCKPKSEKRYLLAVTMGVSEHWLCGYTNISQRGARLVHKPVNNVATFRRVNPAA